MTEEKTDEPHSRAAFIAVMNRSIRGKCPTKLFSAPGRHKPLKWLDSDKRIQGNLRIFSFDFLCPAWENLAWL